MFTQQEQIEQTEQYVKALLENEGSGHDFYHIQRVRQMALHIGRIEGADLFIVEMAALLHDTVDDKLFNEEAAYNQLDQFFAQIDIQEQAKDAIVHILKYMSFKGGVNIGKLKSLEGKVVQDADRIDALGAIGIARTFQFAGKFGEAMYDPNIPIRTSLEDNYREKSTAYNHFFEKLFKLKDLMNTNEGKRLAEERHQYMVDFIRRFDEEWQRGWDKSVQQLVKTEHEPKSFFDFE